MPSRTPNLFLVGAPRCGTTALYTYLKAHPDVFMSPTKELHYFSTDLFQPPPQAPIRTTGEYLAMFAEAGDQRWVGEASPFYIYSVAAAEAIKTFSPDARLIVTLRNPADMMYSMYLLRVRAASFHPAQETSPSFEQALADGPARLRGERLPVGAPTEPGRSLYLCYEELGRYASHVARLIDVFGRQAIHVVIFDDFASDTPAAYEQLCRFLGIDASFRPDFDLSVAKRAGSTVTRSGLLGRTLWRPRPAIASAARALLPPVARRALRDRLERWNQRPPRPMNANTRRRVLDACARDVRRLSDLLGRDLTHWLELEDPVERARRGSS
jgi:hypothetical protein